MPSVMREVLITPVCLILSIWQKYLNVNVHATLLTFSEIRWLTILNILRVISLGYRNGCKNCTSFIQGNGLEVMISLCSSQKIPISHLRLVWSFSGFDGFLTVNCCHTKPDIIPEESRSRNIKEGWILVDEFSKHFFLKTTCYDPPGSGNVRRKYSELNTKEDGDVTELLTAVT
ncbi:uncharacterized protein [Apostichopus japonicus]|uniref:uncharacterized protein isoform X2 n=1 Tax=Stichopus japonicus TaxID=307972 RepID=UPI003AB8CF38